MLIVDVSAELPKQGKHKIVKASAGEWIFFQDMDKEED